MSAHLPPGNEVFSIFTLATHWWARMKRLGLAREIMTTKLGACFMFMNTWDETLIVRMVGSTLYQFQQEQNKNIGIKVSPQNHHHSKRNAGR